MADTGEDIEAQLRESNEQLYKHSHDLAVRNKTLSLLRRLYQISIQTLEPEVLARQILDLVRTELDLELVGVMSYDVGANTLHPIEFSVSDRVKEACSSCEFVFTDTVIESASEHSVFGKAFSGTSTTSTDLAEIWNAASATTLSTLSEKGHIREMLVEALRIDAQNKGVLLMGFNRSISELSQFERESIDSLVDVVAVALDRAQVYEELKLANERQVTLIHFITHQIKGFVAKSRNIFSMALEGDFGPVGDDLRPMLQAGLDSDTQGVNTIQEILNASNIKSGKVTYTMAPFDLKQLIDEITESLKPNAEKKGIALNTSTDSVTYTGDRAQLTNAFKNLIDNSIKYTQKGEVQVRLKQGDGKVLFTIEDTGVGITPEDMQNLFTEGGHGKESTKVNVESTGFGLYIVKNIIEAHKGKVWAESEGAGKGSRFFVELPA
jgi:signal transduction histidine kinase